MADAGTFAMVRFSPPLLHRHRPYYLPESEGQQFVLAGWVVSLTTGMAPESKCLASVAWQGLNLRWSWLGVAWIEGMECDSASRGPGLPRGKSLIEVELGGPAHRSPDLQQWIA